MSQRLKSRKSCLGCVSPSCKTISERCDLWRKLLKPLDYFIELSENLPSEHALPWSVWIILNRLRTRVGHSKDNPLDRGFRMAPTFSGLCGVSPQFMIHLLSCAACSVTCTLEDLMDTSANGVTVAEYRVKHKIICFAIDTLRRVT